MRTGCGECREAVSARLDGEELPGEAARVEAHLAECSECRAWADRAARITRLTRARIAEPEPDVVAGVLAAVDADPPDARLNSRMWWRDSLRFALGGVGLAQLALAASSIVAIGGHRLGAEPAGAMTVHVAHESAAWNLAVGIGFLGAATARRRGTGLVPVLGAFVVVLAGLSVLDLLAGRVEPGRLLGHGLVVVGLILLVALQRPTDTGGGGSDRGSRADPASPWTVGRSAVPPPGAGPDEHGDGQPMRPTGRVA